MFKCFSMSVENILFVVFNKVPMIEDPGWVDLIDYSVNVIKHCSQVN